MAKIDHSYAVNFMAASVADALVPGSGLWPSVAPVYELFARLAAAKWSSHGPVFAHDAIQDAVDELKCSAATISDASKFVGFARTVFSRAAIRLHKRLRLDEKVEDLDGPAPGCETDGGLTLQETVADRRLDASSSLLERSIDDLLFSGVITENQYRAFVYCKQRGFSTAEAAALMKCSADYVRHLVSDAVKIIRHNLGQEWAA